MQATITYLLTEQAQRAQMAATGQPVARKQSVTVEITPEDLPLMAVTDEGVPYLDIAAPLSSLGKQNLVVARHLAKHYENYNLTSTVAEVPAYGADVLAMIRAAIDEQTAKEAAKKEAERTKAVATAAYNEAVSAWAIASPEAIKCNYWYDVPAGIREQFPEADQAPQLNAAARQAINERAEQAARRREVAEGEKKAAEAARESAKQAYIAQWIAEHADEQTRAQFDDGLLCRQTALRLIADSAFTAAGVPDKASYDDEFCKDSDCPCGEKTVDCLPRSVYPRWKGIAAGLPQGYEVKFTRVRECLKGENWDGEGESAGRPFYGAEIKLPHGPFVFERTVKLA